MIGAVVIAAVVGIPTALLVSRSGATTSPVATPVATPTPNASQRAAAAQASALYTQALAAAEQSAGFSYSATSSSGGTTLMTVTGAAGQDDGTQVFNQTTAYGDEQFSLVLASNQTVYFQGNAAAVEDQLGVSAGAAPAVSGEWVSVQIGDGPYKNLEIGITVGSQLSETILDATSTQQVTGSGGVQLTRISGSVPASSTSTAGTGHLDISPSTHLPASYVVSYTGAGTETETFTEWGTSPSVTAPATAVAWSTLTASAPPDGYGSGETPTPGPTPTPAGGGSA
ncbi:MAG: hypothetical protein ABR950_03565 [Candidatus Dormibacteria bacterium]